MRSLVTIATVLAALVVTVEPKPRLRKSGTIDLAMVETTPLVFRGKLKRFESVRKEYRNNHTGDSYFRFVDVADGRPSPAFAKGKHLGSAIVVNDEAFVFGVARWGGSKIFMYRSKDLKTWNEREAIELPGRSLFNTSVCDADGRFLMAIEIGGPAEAAGVPFTMRFAESNDLKKWLLLDASHVYSKEKYTACPALRFVDGYFYMIYLESRPGPKYETHIVRSRDLIRWESSPFNPVLAASDQDKTIAEPSLSPDERRLIARAKNINNSDVDLCEYRGKTVIYYSWGNQQGTEFLASAEYDGSLKAFLQGFFP